MKIKFTKLPTTGGKIQVSFDGGQSFNDYNIADIHDSGIPLDDSQDYEKIQIQGPANVLKNLNIIKGIGLGDSDDNSSSGNFTPKLQLQIELILFAMLFFYILNPVLLRTVELEFYILKSFLEDCSSNLPYLQ